MMIMSILVAAAPHPLPRAAVGAAQGGLREHINVMNIKCAMGRSTMLKALHINDWLYGEEATNDPNSVFHENRFGGTNLLSLLLVKRRQKNDDDNNNNGPIRPGGTTVPPLLLYSLVCAGTTFDGMHYGHQKLLIVSSIKLVMGTCSLG
jgi:hypothetical protein